MLGAMRRGRIKENNIDDIGVVVVDGNFDLYGKIIFGNKYLLKILET